MTERIPLSSIVVHQWQCDHFGHLNVRHYAAAFDDGVFVLWHRLGAVTPARGKPCTIPVTAETKTSFVSEAIAGAIARLEGQVLRVGSKSVTLRLEMLEERSGQLLASCEVVEVFFDMQARQSRPIPSALRTRLMAAAGLGHDTGPS